MQIRCNTSNYLHHEDNHYPKWTAAHNWSTEDYWDSEVGRHDMDEHTVGRLIYDRHEYIPWLNELRRLDGARVLEIGCGTGKQTPRFQAAAFDTTSEGAKLELSRRGRGVSYHDIELALGPACDLDFAVDRQTFQMRQNPLQWLYYRRSSNRRYADLLRRQRPDLPFGLFMPYLNVAIRKSTG